jgi:hypothetical protein
MTTTSAPRPRSRLAYDEWIETLDVPIYRGHFVSDLRKIELGWWAERQSNVAFLNFKGMDGVSEARITEIPPGATLPPLKMAVGETIYVLDGSGFATVWAGDGPKRSFEWQPHSMFHIPRHSHYQLGNGRGDRPARVLQYNYLPMAMTVTPDPDFFINNPFEDPDRLYKQDLHNADDPYSQARPVLGAGASDKKAEAMGAIRDDSLPAANHGGAWWVGNFFPDMGIWDNLSPHRARGAGGLSVKILFPGTGMSASMSVFDASMYKKAHLHGPGRVIVIPAGEGYSVLWEPGKERVICPWGEAAVFTPPGGWYHQHFNLGDKPARYLKFGHLPQLSGAGDHRNQIEYSDEDPWVREHFEAELNKRGKASLMPPAIYADRDYQWDYGDDD